MSIEPCEGAGRIDAKTDIYSLGNSIGQSTASRRRRIRFIGLGAGGLALFGVVLLVLLRGREPTKPQPAQTAVAPEQPIERPAPPPIKKIRWSIETQPAGASALDEGGTWLGVTPWQSEQPLATGTTSVRLRKDGYADATITLDRDKDVTRQLALSRARKPEPATASKITRPATPTTTTTPPPPAKPAKRVGYED